MFLADKISVCFILSQGKNRALTGTGNTKGGIITVLLTSCLTVVWNQLYDNGQFMFLFAKQTNPNQSTVQ
jgi:hypothetical protein